MIKIKKKGFTLVELMVVIVIIGILVAIIVPSVTSAIDAANRQAAIANAKSSLTDWTIKVTSGEAGYTYTDENGEQVALSEAEALRIMSGTVYTEYENNTEKYIVLKDGVPQNEFIDKTDPSVNAFDHYIMTVTSGGVALRYVRAG